MLNVGIVGLGGIGNNHANCYKKIDGVKLVAVCDIVKERADKAAAAHGATAFYSVDELLKNGPKLDGCSVCTSGKDGCKPYWRPSPLRTVNGNRSANGSANSRREAA